MAAAAMEGAPFPEDKKNYIIHVLDPILEQMIHEVLIDTPTDVLGFMQNWLQKKYRITPLEDVSLTATHHKLKKELASMQEFIATSASVDPAKEAAEDDEEEDDSDDEMEPYEPPEATMRSRASVSAEAYGDWNKANQAFKPPIHPKSTLQTAGLTKILTASFLFSKLEQKDLDIVLLAMVERCFPAGARIITEGDDGNHLYVIETGNPVCNKLIADEQVVIKQCGPGDVFGELALLYNTPRAASVVAVDACKCWELDRQTFSHIVKDSATRRMRQHEEFVARVMLFKNLSPYEVSQICDCLKPEYYTKDEAVVNEGDQGDRFFIVEEGALLAMKGRNIVMQYKSGDYFGELALLKNQPRAATIKVVSNTAKVLYLNRKAFVTMLGPLQDILVRSADLYK